MEHLIYIYDGSFEGLLTAIYEAYYRREQPDSIVSGQALQKDLFSREVIIKTDSEKADKVYHSIRQKISQSALRHVYYVYLSDMEQAGTYIYKYLRLGWKIGKDIDRYLSLDEVLQVHNISRKVGNEKHRMLGLVCFRCLQGNIYYASIEPDYNIVGLIAPHFAKRLSDQKWVIHDLKRNLAAMYNTKEWIIAELDANIRVAFEKEERDFQQLWKQYFQSIAIKDRINPRLQKSNMPMKYWKHLIEKW